jgi:lipoprotein-anchoring transpeptidase ErfK/SrfK
MSALRVLGLSYLATASLFSLALFFSDHAALSMVTREETGAAANFFQMQVVTPLLGFARLEDEKIFDPQVSVALSAPGPNDARLLAHATVPAVPEKKVTASQFAAPQPYIIAPDLPEIGEGYGGSLSPPLPKFTAPEAANLMPPDLEGASALTPAERATVTAQLSQNLTPEMLKNFDLFLYVSKAGRGPLAQRLYIFKKDSSGTLQMAYDWAASTGREEYEISPVGTHTKTDTPAGLYELDPSRMYRVYHSHAWDQSMPYAMFFNWETHGDQTGLAIHAAVGEDIGKLGSRASAGCVHISLGHAQLLYDMIRADYKGKVPRFAYDAKNQTMSNRGDMMRDDSGNLVMADGYKVLIDIEYLSGANMVASLN